MSSQLKPRICEAPETLRELRERLGLFSFQDEVRPGQSATQSGSWPELGIRPGDIVEWLVARQGAGAVTSALEIMSRSLGDRGVWAVVDPAREFYVPALSGWGARPGRTLLVRPATLQETCWAIEQCLRCPGVSATWAWVEKRLSPSVFRRWKLAAEVGGGLGLFFRQDWAQREPVWADLRLRVTPQAGGQGETRGGNIDVLYRRGGKGGSVQAWEIDHAAGVVRLVPKVADPATAERAARA